MKENNQINKTIIGEPGKGMSCSLKETLLDAIFKGVKIMVITEGEYRDLQKEDLVRILLL